MLVLIPVGLLAGVVTALSPCVLPVLPIVLAGGATGRRPLHIVAGLVVSFTVFTLGAAWLLGRLGLPEDTLRNLAILTLGLVAATLLVPALGDLVARPLERLSRRPAGELGGGVLLGASLGLVFVPCAGPVLAAVTVLAATHRVGVEAIVLTAAYAVGVAGPLLLIALAGRGAAARLKAHALTLRRVSGVAIGAAALAMALGADRNLQTLVPGYTEFFQRHVEASGRATRELSELTGSKPVTSRPVATAKGRLPDYGPAPEFARITTWLNGPPLTIAGLRGKVVLIDFWTYSCINCLRTLPHVEHWAAAYRDAGLVVVGVHTPEFAFERVVANVRDNARRLGVRHPVAIDNDYGTWTAWGNQYWPATYLVDRSGRVRRAHFGEGDYAETEASIRTLLAERGARLPARTALADPTPIGSLTPETYLGAARLARYAGSTLVPGIEGTYVPPQQLRRDELAYAGRWRVEAEHIVAGEGATIRLDYTARDVFAVLAGRGTATVRVDGRPSGTVRVSGARLYTVVRRERRARHELELGLTPGLRAYSFTFG